MDPYIYIHAQNKQYNQEQSKHRMLKQIKVSPILTWCTSPSIVQISPRSTANGPRRLTSTDTLDSLQLKTMHNVSRSNEDSIPIKRIACPCLQDCTSPGSTTRCISLESSIIGTCLWNVDITHVMWLNVIAWITYCR